ncbi:MAG: PEP-CTERM system histidine kinase PrsK [Betaproteobacteria bacterium]|nr:PEP-CTERM system histidine kinase PrsK [Betaproteobacteria bacterium]
MSNTSLQPAFWCYLLASLFFAGHSAVFIFRQHRGTGHWLHVGASVASALWTASAAWLAYDPAPILATWHWQLDTFRLGVWLLFIVVLLRARSPATVAVTSGVAGRRWLTAAIAVGVLFTALLQPSEDSTTGYYLALALTIAGLVMTEQFLAQAGTPRWWVIKPFVLGLGALLVFDLIYYSSGVLYREPDPQLWSARGIVHALAALIVAISAARSRGWRDELQLSHVAAFRVTSIVLAGIYLVLISAGAYWVVYFGGDWGGTLKVAFVFAALLALVGIALSGQWRAALRVSIAKNLFTYRYDYRTEWSRFTEQLASRSLGDTDHQRMIRALGSLVESPGGQLWIRLDHEYCAIDGLEAPSVSCAEPFGSSLVSFLDRTHWVIDLDEFRARKAKYAGLELPAWLLNYDEAWIVVPLATGSELTGFVILHHALTKVEIGWEVRDILKMAGTQLAVHLSELRVKAQLVEAERFDAFNRMSAYVVHDLKNLVAQLDLLVRNAERHRQNPEFQSDMLETVQHAVSRMQQLMLQLRSGSVPADPARRIDLSSILRKVVEGKAAIGAAVDQSIRPDVIVAGHPDRVERVAGHLIQNAMEASTSPSSTIGVRLTVADGRAVLEVSDSGVGMSETFVREKLFHPFQTTKPNGMGIGMYESAQYLKSINGRIEVRSVPFAGSTFRVEFPLLSGAEGAPT